MSWPLGPGLTRCVEGTKAVWLCQGRRVDVGRRKLEVQREVAPQEPKPSSAADPKQSRRVRPPPPLCALRSLHHDCTAELPENASIAKMSRPESARSAAPNSRRTATTLNAPRPSSSRLTDAEVGPSDSASNAPASHRRAPSGSLKPASSLRTTRERRTEKTTSTTKFTAPSQIKTPIRAPTLNGTHDAFGGASSLARSRDGPPPEAAPMQSAPTPAKKPSRKGARSDEFMVALT